MTSCGEGSARYTLKVDFWHDLHKFDLLTDAQNIRCQTLLVHGEKDTAFPVVYSRNLNTRIKSELRIISGAGHSYDGAGQIAEFKAIALNFLRKHLTNTMAGENICTERTT